MRLDGARLANFGFEDNSVTLQANPITRSQFLRNQKAAPGAIKLLGLGNAAYAIPAPVFQVNVFSHGESIIVNITPSTSLRPAEHLAALAVSRLH